MPVVTYRDALNQALREEMQRDDRVFLMGEEVGVYQGAYKVSKGLLQEFGEMRVVDTPITELGFAGVGVGAAMVGLRPVIEFMTWNFALLAIDQVVTADAKMLYMSGGQFKVPIVFRGPNGAALQLSAQHSQAWESWLAHIPGLKVIAPATPYDAKGLLKSAIRDDNPVCVLEGEMLYNTKGEVPEDDYVIPLGKADLKREGDHCSIITHGKMVLVAMQAADQLAKDGIRIDVVDLRTVRPMDVEAIPPTMEEGRLVQGLKNEGDAVKSGEPIGEVETDKAIMELVARGDGVLRKRLINEGDTAPVGTLVGVIGAKDENIDALVAGAGGGSTAPAAAAPTAASQQAGTPQQGTGPSNSE